MAEKKEVEGMVSHHNILMMKIDHILASFQNRNEWIMKKLTDRMSGEEEYIFERKGSAPYLQSLNADAVMMIHQVLRNS